MEGDSLTKEHKSFSMKLAIGAGACSLLVVLILTFVFHTPPAQRSERKGLGALPPMGPAFAMRALAPSMGTPAECVGNCNKRRKRKEECVAPDGTVVPYRLCIGLPPIDNPYQTCGPCIDGVWEPEPMGYGSRFQEDPCIGTTCGVGYTNQQHVCTGTYCDPLTKPADIKIPCDVNTECARKLGNDYKDWEPMNAHDIQTQDTPVDQRRPCPMGYQCYYNLAPVEMSAFIASSAIAPGSYGTVEEYLANNDVGSGLLQLADGT